MYQVHDHQRQYDDGGKTVTVDDAERLATPLEVFPMTLPNLVIAGAPKCGTTSLFRWLADHPEVVTSKVKETFYLMDPTSPFAKPDAIYEKQGLIGYEAFFADCAARKPVVLEATTHYIYQQTAVDVLSTLPSRPKIVFVLREPAQRVYSDYRFKRDNQARFRQRISFSQYLDLMQEPHHQRVRRYYVGPPEQVLNEIQQSQYIDYLAQWLDCFGRDRIDVLLLEDIRNDPRAVVTGLADRIGIAPDFYDEYQFVTANQTVGIRNRRLHRIARKLRGVVPEGPLKRGLTRTYGSMFTTTPESVSPEDSQILARLREHFVPYNRRLAELFDIDLSAWTRS